MWLYKLSVLKGNHKSSETTNQLTPLHGSQSATQHVSKQELAFQPTLKKVNQ